MAQSEPGQYATIKIDRDDGQKMTQLLCPHCRETFFIEGHEWFDEAMPARELNLPPGFVIPRTRMVD